MAVKGNCGSRDLKEQENFPIKLQGRNGKLNPHMTAKAVQEGLAVIRVMVRSSTLQYYCTIRLYMTKSPRRKEGKSPILTRNEKRLRLFTLESKLLFKCFHFLNSSKDVVMVKSQRMSRVTRNYLPDHEQSYISININSY